MQPGDPPRIRQLSSDYGSYGADFPEGFDDRIVRHNFIRKVYSILTAQILVTIALTSFFMFYKPVTLWVYDNPWAYIVVLVLLFVVMLLLVCCEKIRRKFPLNFIFLGIFTILEGVCMGLISAHYRINHVLLAFSITAAVVFALTIFAFQTKCDFTLMGTGLMIVLLVLTIFGIVTVFVKMKILNLIYSCLGALLFCFYLVYDTQMMMGGKHKYSISPEEYIVAALCLYLDIINIFIMILNIFGNSDN